VVWPAAKGLRGKKAKKNINFEGWPWGWVNHTQKVKKNKKTTSFFSSNIYF
jgi:hypothetical protein